MVRRSAVARSGRRAAALAACVLIVASWAVPGLTAPAPFRPAAGVSPALLPAQGTPPLGVPPISAQAAPSSDEITITADRVEYNSSTRVARADGHVHATGRGATITADHLEANLATEDVTASGNVKLTQAPGAALPGVGAGLAQRVKAVTGAYLTYNFLAGTGHFEHAAGQLGIWNVAGETIDVAPQQDVASGASITPCDPDHPLYKVTARKIVIVPGEYFTAYDASLWVDGVRVFTVPSYTAQIGRRSGPDIGYNSLDGAYIEYVNSFGLSGWRNEYRIRLATTTGLSAEDVLSQRFGDHVWSVDLGRTQVIDVNGNLANLDRYAVDLVYDQARVPGWPVNAQVEAHGGSYGELLTGVTTTRVQALANLATDTFALSPSVSVSASGSVIYNAYGTGQQQTVLEGSAALSATMNPRATATLSYNVISVNGATPFNFDRYSPSSTVAFNYYYAFGGLVQNAGFTLFYDFLSMQTTVGLTAAVNITPTIAFNVSAYYNLTTQYVSEIDYSLNIRCDCVTVALVYRMYPPSPASNTLQIAVQVPLFDTRNTTF